MCVGVPISLPRQRLQSYVSNAAAAPASAAPPPAGSRLPAPPPHGPWPRPPPPARPPCPGAAPGPPPAPPARPPASAGRTAHPTAGPARHTREEATEWAQRGPRAARAEAHATQQHSCRAWQLLWRCCVRRLAGARYHFRAATCSTQTGNHFATSNSSCPHCAPHTTHDNGHDNDHSNRPQ